MPIIPHRFELRCLLCLAGLALDGCVYVETRELIPYEYSTPAEKGVSPPIPAYADGIEKIDATHYEHCYQEKEWMGTRIYLYPIPLPLPLMAPKLPDCDKYTLMDNGDFSKTGSYHKKTDYCCGFCPEFGVKAGREFQLFGCGLISSN